ncbi:MAG: 2-phospho-L-lactate transferase CofD family protein [Desulfobacteraceae bacterium]|nr:2-phospho-L-lactate transferase CofD family protein [Desulfobacteraceae bacterium]
MSQLSEGYSLGNGEQDALGRALEQLMARQLSAFDLLPHSDLREKLVELVLYGEPASLDAETASQFQHLRAALEDKVVEGVRIVVFGGGTGLSNLIGGDSRSATWARKPFVGLKELFPHTRSIVCVTDDGGSTGELQKDLPLIALGDLRHVLLSSIQSGRLQSLYGLTLTRAVEVVSLLSLLFNHRFEQRPDSAAMLVTQAGVDLACLPLPMGEALAGLIDHLFSDPRLEPTLSRPHCLGNLILAAAIYAEIPPEISNDELMVSHDLLAAPLARGLAILTAILGAEEQAVLPCTSTQAQLSVLYSNGVLVAGEYKSGCAQRGYPVERVFVEFCSKPHVYSEVLSVIAQADILVMAPGSLYSSLIPIFQVPGLAQAVRNNTTALKILVSNLWVQAGETDRSIGDVERKFHVSDLLRAYDRNIPGGTKGLFDQVLCLSLKDVPASVLQNYAVEGKIPIYLDRDQVKVQGFIPIECGIFSKMALAEHGFIQHGPIHLAKVIKTLWAIFDHFKTVEKDVAHTKASVYGASLDLGIPAERPFTRYRLIEERMAQLSLEISEGLAQALDPSLEHVTPGRPCPAALELSDRIRRMVQNILWRHRDIPLAHLDYVRGIVCVDQELWRRSQKWDSVFSFYDPEDGLIKIRQDQLVQEKTFEVAFLVALGQSLLGNYAHHKEMQPLMIDDVFLGKVYHLHLLPAPQRSCWFSDEELRCYLELSRMLPASNDTGHFTRLINGDEGFTPPGMLMGLNYAWYLDNRFASHVEYKMAVMKIAPSSLIPEQVKMLGRRQRMVRFFREVVFRKKFVGKL